MITTTSSYGGQMSGDLQVLVEAGRYVVPAGASLDIGNTFDVSDWEIIGVQIDTLATDAVTSTEINFQVYSAFSNDAYPKFVALNAIVGLSTTFGDSVSDMITSGLRKIARVRFNSTASVTRTVTVRGCVLYKKRTL